MRRVLFLAIASCAGLAAPAPLVAAEVAAHAAEETADQSANEAADQAKPEAGAEARAPAPANAAAALVRAAAAYEYGDMNQVVEAARPVTEGLLPASPAEQAQAFRLLGIGLYLTNRTTGAETAFTELLRKSPKARLDPTTTRPEVVAFFENLRRQQLAHQRSERRIIWNFIPPVGQFQNEDSVKGWALLGVGAVSLGTLGTSYYLLKKWEVNPGHVYPGHENTAATLKAVNWVAAGALVAAYVYGVFDGLIGYSRPLDESKAEVALKVLPEGGVGFAF
jgi:hypothetical protein